MTKARRDLTEAILLLHADGLRPSQIADRVGCSRANVTQTFKRRGIIRRGILTAEMRDDVLLSKSIQDQIQALNPIFDLLHKAKT